MGKHVEIAGIAGTSAVRRGWLLLGVVLLGLGLTGCADGGGRSEVSASISLAGLEATVYLSPTCSCCHGYVNHLRRQGLTVEVVEVSDLTAKKRSLGIPMEMWSCHTTILEGYVVEGHVPFEIVQKLLTERPPIAGIALPGMPSGTPGMPGPKVPITVYALYDNGQTEVYLEQ